MLADRESADICPGVINLSTVWVWPISDLLLDRLEQIEHGAAGVVDERWARPAIMRVVKIELVWSWR